MKKILFITIFFLVSATTAFSQEGGKSCSFLNEYPAKISPGITLTSARTLFYVDNFIPVAGNKDGFFFVNPKAVIGSNDSNEQNVGCGYRRLFADDNVMLGANLYYDTKRSKNNFRHHQLGFGFEAFITEYLDFRSNFYFPISGKKRLSESTSYSFGQRNLIARTETSYEEPLKGMDYEFGLLVPFLSDYLETRAYLGGYNYYSELSDNIHGIKARFEIRPAPSLVIDLSIKHDDTFNTDTYIGGYISLPFNIGNLFQMKNPFEGWKETLKFGEGPRPPRKRMTDMVIRDIDVVSQEAAVTTQESSLANMVYVNNTNDGDANEDGSLSHPYNTLAEGIAAANAGDWVFVYQGDGTATDYTGQYVLPNNTTLWGEGYRYLGLAGGGYPLVDGDGVAGTDTITLGNNNTVMGFEIQNGGRYGIAGINSTSAVVKNNRLHNNGNVGIYFKADAAGNYNALISDNSSYTNGSVGGDGDGIMILSYGGAVYTTTIEGNSCYNHMSGGNNRGIYLGCRASTINATIRNNTITTSDDDGIKMEMWWNNGTITADIYGNSISQCNSDGIFFSLHNNNQTVTASLYNNVITNNGQYGIDLDPNVPATDTISIDAGGGDQNSVGFNSIYNNSILEVYNDDDAMLKAENNYWGTAPAPWPGQFGGASGVDYDPSLNSDPN